MFCSLGVIDRAMDALASCVANNPGEQNIRRNLHNLIHRQGKTLPLDIDFAVCSVRKTLGKVQIVQVFWPILLLSTWLRYALVNASELILAGANITNASKWQDTFRKFWKRYRNVDPTHPVFSLGPGVDLGSCWPYTIHGDEGRGKNKMPVMVESFCPVIPRRGMRSTNLKG